MTVARTDLPRLIHRQYARSSCFARDGNELFDRYRRALEPLGNEKRAPGLVFGMAQNKRLLPANIPSGRDERPSSEFLRWHNENRFLS